MEGAMPYGLVLDLLFAGLLVATLVYMARLNRRLDALRAGREELEALVKRFTDATEPAQSNVGAMKAAAESTGRNLQEEIDRARGLREDLTFLTDRANALADQLEVAITRSRPTAVQAPAPSNVARMPTRGEEPRGVSAASPSGASAATNAPQASAPQGGPALSTSENELLRRLSTLR